jgi:PAS domain S-box-containing protein
MTVSKKALQEELDALRAKYEESEELLHAIRTGGVDGLLVQSPEGPRVYTLKSAEHPYRMMVEQMHEGAATLDPTGVLLYANRRLAELIDAPLERLVGFPFLPHVDLPFRERFEELLGEERAQYEARILDGRGRAIPVNLSLSTLKADADRYVCLVVTDLTALKQNEDLRIAHAEAERVSRAKDEFMAMVSHELRTPMTSILGWASLVKITADDVRLTETGLDAILQSAKVQARLIDDLLDMSRLESGKLSVIFATLDFSELVRNAVETLRVTSKDKQVRIESHLPPERVLVRGDSNRLHQVVWNLLSNAFKFSRAGGQVDVHLVARDGAAELRVLDDGVGIDPSYLPRVFERFSQADTTTTRSFGGLGLGLSIVRHLVSVHKGTVEAYSEGENRGATFTVRIPLATGRQSDDVEAQPTLADLTGVTVLIVEDDLESRDFLAATVSRAGGRPLTAGNVGAAMQLLSIEQPDVVVSDIAMPGEDGLSFVRRLRTHDQERHTHTPVIAVSALGAPEAREKVLRAGFDVVLEKPVQALAFSRAVANALPGR